MSAPEPSARELRVGAVLYGFCGGHFGRDSYDDKRIEALGADWIVAREISNGAVVFANFSHGDGWTLDALTPYLTEEPDPHT